jgi:hypothetical protein
MHVYLHILQIFFPGCKKRQKMCREIAYFGTKFCHFYVEHIKKLVFVETTS